MHLKDRWENPINNGCKQQEGQDKGGARKQMEAFRHGKRATSSTVPARPPSLASHLQLYLRLALVATATSLLWVAFAMSLTFALALVAADPVCKNFAACVRR